MSERAPRPTRGDYAVWRRATTRWADDDAYGHMNNARYFEIIDTVVNNHLEQATGTDIRLLPAIGVVAEVGCKYFAEVGYPAPVDVVYPRQVRLARIDPLPGRLRLQATDGPWTTAIGDGEPLEVRASAEVLLRLLWHRADPRAEGVDPRAGVLLSGAVTP